MAAREIDNWLQMKLFHEVPVSICVIDRGFRIVQANKRFEKTYGEWKNRPCYSVYKGRDHQCDNCAALATFVDGKVRSREEQGIIGDERSINHYFVQMIPIVRTDEMINYVIEMSTDITTEKMLEQEKREAERLAAVGETVAGIAHGIKNVLMALEGGMYGVTTGIEQGDDDRVAKGWTMLQENITRLSRFVKEFLAFARGRVAKASFVDPYRLGENVAEEFREQANIANVELRTDLQENIAPSPMDEEEIYSCLVNLVSNALDACQMSETDRSYIVTLTLRDKNGVLSFEVSDNGCGIDYEISKKIFTSFFSGKGADKGTGLGLLTTKKIVHQHGGKVSFESEPGKGSLFRIELPRVNLPEVQDIDNCPLSGGGNGQGKN